MRTTCFFNVTGPEDFNRDNKVSIYLLLTEEGKLYSLPSGDGKYTQNESDQTSYVEREYDLNGFEVNLQQLVLRMH